LDSETNELSKIADISPWLNEDDLAEMKPISYQSRDGLTIHGYLTLPKGYEAKNLPVVINPHGGPWHRDYWGFNPEVQLLANRGYAVLQMNFRGSTGYGKEFWLKSVKQWGRSMQDDITDGVNWLINKGIADPERIAIYGGSYGGYATLAGLTFTPDVYACGIDYVGVSNMFTFMNTIPPYWEPMRELFYELVGDPVEDSLLLAEVSPVFHADKIQVPLFIAQGANDPRVNKAESDQMVEALKQRGIEVEYMVKDNEGHGFRNEENRFDFYRAMDAFLAEHIGDSVQTAN
jgi:dipeptidyl aminopeptidase/acylaminoacyl peptidase